MKFPDEDAVVKLQEASRVGGLYRAVEDHVMALRRRDNHDALLTELALDGAVAAYLRPDGPDLSDAHVDRVARRLFRAFDDANIGREPLHDFDVIIECERGDHWYALAREAIRLGAIVAVEEVP